MHSQQSQAEKRYHLVCRDCPVEELFETADDAVTAKRDHAAETDHWIAVGRVT